MEQIRPTGSERLQGFGGQQASCLAGRGIKALKVRDLARGMGSNASGRPTSVPSFGRKKNGRKPCSIPTSDANHQPPLALDWSSTAFKHSRKHSLGANVDHVAICRMQAPGYAGRDIHGCLSSTFDHPTLEEVQLASR